LIRGSACVIYFLDDREIAAIEDRCWEIFGIVLVKALRLDSSTLAPRASISVRVASVLISVGAVNIWGLEKHLVIE